MNLTLLLSLSLPLKTFLFKNNFPMRGKNELLVQFSFRLQNNIKRTINESIQQFLALHEISNNENFSESSYSTEQNIGHKNIVN